MNEFKPLKVLVLEDMKTDRELVKRQVLKFNPKVTFTMAENRDSFIKKMDLIQPDLILSDYDLPDYTGFEALILVKEKMPDVPFIFVTGTLNDEEKVAQVMLKGADEYVLKDNLKTLPKVLQSVVERNAARIKRAAEQAEKKRKQSILIQKMSAKLESISDASAKEELKNLMDELQSL